MLDRSLQRAHRPLGKNMPHISLDHGSGRIKIAAVEIESEIAFAYFDKLPDHERDDAFKRALNLGVMALHQDRLSTFLAKTTNELGTELESLKILFDLKAELYSKSSVKGSLGEVEIADFLQAFLAERKIKDVIALTGSAAGALPKNKTGDILCTLEGQEDRRIVIECKFDKGIAKGEVADVSWFGNRTDTALGQLVEAQANRECRQAIIVFDRSSASSSILKAVGNIAFVPQFGFLVIVDSLRGQFDNLAIAYMLARDMALADRELELETDLLQAIVERLISDAKRVSDIRLLVEKNIQNSRDILAKLEQGRLSLEFCRGFLQKFLQTGTLTRAELHEFYTGGDTKARYRLIDADIQKLIEGS